MKFVMIYGASGVGKQSVATELAKRNGWKVFPQHCAFDLACAAVGFGNNGFEKYQRKLCIDAFDTLLDNNAEGVVFTFCYVYPASNYFIAGLQEWLTKRKVDANFIKITCDYEEHLQRVLSPERKNTNKIQSKQYLDDYLQRFNFSVDIPGVKSFEFDSTFSSIAQSADTIETYLAQNN